MTFRDCESYVLLGMALVTGGCTAGRDDLPHDPAPRSREVVITTIPLLTKELTQIYPFLQRDFDKKGILQGKEVYSFEPSTITVALGDTLNFTFINPEDDPHSFVMKDFSVSLPPQTITHGTYVARSAGIFDFFCAIPAHLPMMRGQLVVLAPQHESRK
jgi:plastocyanin